MTILHATERHDAEPRDGEHGGRGPTAVGAAPLPRVQRTLHDALRGARPVAEAAAELGLPEARVELYRRFVRAHVLGVLAKDFPLVREALPEATWDALAEAFYHAHPPHSVELNRAAEPFPAFLEAAASGPEGGEGGPYPGLTPFHASLASLEWAEFVAYTHEGRVPAHGDVDAPTLNPTLTVVSLPVPALEYALGRLDAGEGDAAPAPPPVTPGADPELVLLFRPPPPPGVAGTYAAEPDRVALYRATDDLLFALKVTHDGLDPAAAATAAGLDPVAAAQAVAHAASLGLVILPAP